MFEIIKEDHKHWRATSCLGCWGRPVPYWATTRPLLLAHPSGFSIRAAWWCSLSSYTLHPCIGSPSELI